VTEAAAIPPWELLKVNRIVLLFPAPVRLHEVVVPTFTISVFAQVTRAPGTP
jgi:hypothetical protein